LTKREGEEVNIAFISPRGTERNQQNNILYEIFRKLIPVLSFMIDDIEFIPNLGLLQLAALVGDEHEVKYIDEDYIDIRDAEPVLFEKKWDIVGISACNNQALRAYEIADRFREQGITVVMGGYHPSAMPEEAKLHADAVFIGEGEDTFPQFLEDFKRGEIKPFYKSTGNVDISTLPPPRFDCISNIIRFNKLPVFATRGCPRKCEYCSVKMIYGSRYRKKNIDQIVREIEDLKKLYPRPYPFITFGDENLLVDKQWSKELAKALIPLKIRWECYCDVSVAWDDELLDLLRESNCVELLIGFESIVRENMNMGDRWKYNMVSKYAEAIKRIQSKGVGVMGLFMFGFDHDTPDVFKETAKFIHEAGLFDVDFAVLCPIPGTDTFNKLKEEGRILTYNWNKYTWIHVNYQPMNMTAKALQEGLLYMFKEFSSIEILHKRKQYFKGIYERLASTAGA
jgi:radical SAM superfamily enzyme YgiQ (UPF0313 family)